ncbi:hypothetical protein OR1_03206 [Geobacter sp. OR-1]|uniref:hypothetical protein n=1 Tax=Geobacter sp. OR-1 TaxID=1266765 RepID=UPI000542DF9D|nr:hypothetical protein [Geobacter sp. OR-1]GAM10906.1 hypothetical protein OR1_03206 [Geobacter sp. OR-1]
MNDEYKPSPDFVAKVMQRVHAYEAEKVSFIERIFWSRPVRYALAGGGTVFGILKAAPVF